MSLVNFSFHLDTLEDVGGGVGRVFVHKQEDEPNPTEGSTLAKWADEASAVHVCVCVCG